MKVAIVHDWLTNYGGAETFVELWLRMYPQADIYIKSFEPIIFFKRYLHTGI